METKVYDKYISLAKYYKLDSRERKVLWNIIKPIALHKEFIKRCNKPFYHHDTKMLGEHIISDAIVTYKLCKKVKKSNFLVDTKTAVIIAMFHDLYVEPWQNNPKKKILPNKHGFVHPVEAIVNAITWYPEYFKTKDKSLVIIDGVIHHMFPLGVRRFDNLDMELNNKELYEKLDTRYKDMINLVLNSAKVGHLSLRRSFFLEGRIMSKADKIVAFSKDLSSIRGYLALIGVKNKNIMEGKVKK